MQVLEKPYLQTVQEADEYDFFQQSLQLMKLPELPTGYRYKYDWNVKNESELKIQKQWMKLPIWITTHKASIEPKQDNYFSYLEEIEVTARFLAVKLDRRTVNTMETMEKEQEGQNNELLNC